LMGSVPQRVVGASSRVRYFSSSAKKGVVGFIGLGNMGAHQAGNLLRHGHDLLVFDLSSAAVDALKEKGAKVAASPKEIAAGADVIVTMLPASAHVREAYLGPNGILSAVRSGALLMDSSTIDPQTAREVAKKAAEKNAIMVDCPVSGGTQGAAAATLTFMVGGSNEGFERAKPYLSCMGKNIVHCGDAGTGQVAKVANNLVLGISMIAVSEAMNLGVKLGMDPKKLAGIFNTSTARCWSSEVYNPCPGVIDTAPAARGYTGGFGAKLMLKDLGLAVESAKGAGEALPLGTAAHQLYQLLVTHGYGDKDFSVFYDYLQHHKNI